MGLLLVLLLYRSLLKEVRMDLFVLYTKTVQLDGCHAMPLVVCCLLVDSLSKIKTIHSLMLDTFSHA